MGVPVRQKPAAQMIPKAPDCLPDLPPFPDQHRDNRRPAQNPEERGEPRAPPGRRLLRQFARFLRNFRGLLRSAVAGKAVEKLLDSVNITCNKKPSQCRPEHCQNFRKEPAHAVGSRFAAQEQESPDAK